MDAVVRLPRSDKVGLNGFAWRHVDRFCRREIRGAGVEDRGITIDPARASGDRIIVGTLASQEFVLSGWKFGEAKLACRIRSRVVLGHPAWQAVRDFPVIQLDVRSRKRLV